MANFSILSTVNLCKFPLLCSADTSSLQAEFYGQFWETAQSSDDFLDVFEALHQPRVFFYMVMACCGHDAIIPRNWDITVYKYINKEINQ